jgi:hypothetical protein
MGSDFINLQGSKARLFLINNKNKKIHYENKS